KAIQQKDSPEVENLVNTWAEIVINSISNKEMDILREGIDMGHDFVKSYIRNNDMIFKKMELLGEVMLI
ncbi:MAG: hypothetical protein ABIH09_04205, partial [Candidatus Omnitrophota bacterium]